MGVKSIYTPRSRIVQALRQLWLRSRERADAIKRDKYTCVRCGIKQTKRKGQEVKVNVHHKSRPDWDKIIEYVRKELLQTADAYETLCEECHHKEHHE